MTDPAPAPSIHAPGALDGVRRQLGLDPEHVRRFRNALYKFGRPLSEAMASWPDTARAGLADLCQLQGLEEVSRSDSTSDGASKLLLRTQGGLLLETVLLRIQSGRTSLCVSSQIGCAAKCSFCATGKMQMARNLSVEEILEQVVIANRHLGAEGRRVRNVVFMGMGEPLHNRHAVEAAVQRLLDPKWFDLSANHILISTVGILDELRAFVARFPDVNLALSLHAARQEVRERLIPLAKLQPISAIRQCLQELQCVRQKPVMLEYLMLAGVNDRDEDLQALVTFCAELRVHINLIPFNAIEDAPGLTPTPPEQVRQAANRLKAAGLRVTTRFSLGRDVDAACGQLVRLENRRLALPPRARPV